MTVAHFLAITAHVVSLSIHAGAARTHFESPEGTPSRSRLIAALFLVFAFTSSRLLMIAPINTTSAIAALVVYSLAARLFFSATYANRERPLTVAFTNDTPRHLVTAGPYGYIRHPFYASYCLTWLASAVATHNPVLVAVFLCMTLVYRYAARFEECKFVKSELASEYARYRSLTGMFLPRWRAISKILYT
jgi:protein-S-isoprenylcysteine O-methyltransferase Ste14